MTEKTDTTDRWPEQKRDDLRDLCCLMFGSFLSGAAAAVAFAEMTRMPFIADVAFIIGCILLLMAAASAGDRVWCRIYG